MNMQRGGMAVDSLGHVYTFTIKQDGRTTTISNDELDIQKVVEDFKDFLLAAGWQPGSISQYIQTDEV